jgi:hypothetical protein
VPLVALDLPAAPETQDVPETMVAPVPQDPKDLPVPPETPVEMVLSEMLDVPPSANPSSPEIQVLLEMLAHKVSPANPEALAQMVNQETPDPRDPLDLPDPPATEETMVLPDHEDPPALRESAVSAPNTVPWTAEFSSKTEQDDKLFDPTDLRLRFFVFYTAFFLFLHPTPKCRPKNCQIFFRIR